ncbi:MAG: hypothetical protein IPP44_00420 [Ideonella sp.]|jgi:hypothetical protein|nr:hypothetical protein [Ideonella sp.]
MKPQILFALVPVLASSAIAQSGSVFGEWRGQAQYNATVRGKPDAAGHSVVAFTIVVQPGGKVLAASSENGCKFVGLATPGVVPSILNLDVMASGCSYSSFNQRLTGTLAHYEREKNTIVSLHSTEVGFARVAGYFEIKATLKR